MRMTRADALRELELLEGAPEDEVRTAYKKLALRWHPDKNDDEEATEKFKRINSAYNTLTKVCSPIISGRWALNGRHPHTYPPAFVAVVSAMHRG
jgi:preprotein translocase subunit Sec63